MTANAGIVRREISLVERYTKGWLQAQHLASVFWKRWRQEYLPTLQISHKWLKVERNLRVGDLVLILGGDSSRGYWPKGIVSEVFPG
ncbi:hypothetical protein H7673_10880 [Streptococcus dysgalactiae subsp. equisimilis]|nr:hypothetical protein [Streptococcus dysgalactiae subsp. equisimilis]